MSKKVISMPSVGNPKKDNAMAEPHTRVICNIGGKRYALDFWSRDRRQLDLRLVLPHLRMLPKR
jgi:hypothetical protein